MCSSNSSIGLFAGSAGFASSPPSSPPESSPKSKPDLD
jgi:hypothetical protein